MERRAEEATGLGGWWGWGVDSGSQGGRDTKGSLGWQETNKTVTKLPDFNHPHTERAGKLRLPPSTHVRRPGWSQPPTPMISTTSPPTLGAQTHSLQPFPPVCSPPTGFQPLTVLQVKGGT